MNYSTKISERMWNQPDKGEFEAEREYSCNKAGNENGMGASRLCRISKHR